MCVLKYTPANRLAITVTTCLHMHTQTNDCTASTHIVHLGSNTDSVYIYSKHEFLFYYWLQHLKVPIIRASLLDIISYVLIRNSGWSPELALNLDAQPNNINWTQELCNTTGILCNVSSAENILNPCSAQGLV